MSERRGGLALEAGPSRLVDLERVEQDVGDVRCRGSSPARPEPRQPLDDDAVRQRALRRPRGPARDRSGPSGRRRPRSWKPLATSRSTRSAGASWSGDGPDVRPPADATRTGRGPRSGAGRTRPASSGQRRHSSRFQNGSGSIGSTSRMASPRSRRSRPGTAWIRASWSIRRCIVAASIGWVGCRAAGWLVIEKPYRPATAAATAYPAPRRIALPRRSRCPAASWPPASPAGS